jgi:GT2 family glycosyltransferase
MSRPRVAAVVLTYNRWDLIRTCLPTVLAQDWPDLDVLVVDNGSSDGTPEKLAAAFPRVRVLALPKNLGFAGANNAGAAACPAADYVALISNDVELPPEFIRRLAEALEGSPRAGVAGPRVDNLNLDMAQFPKNGTMSVVGTLVPNVFPDPSQAFGAAGCSLMYKRALGLPFDADYGFFHEDVYLAWRARLLGYTVLYVHDVRVRHLGGATLGAISGENRFFMERNRRLNFLTLFSRSTRLRLWPLMWLARALEWAGDLRRARSREPLRRVRAWLREHPGDVRAKRRALQGQRAVPDREIIRWMSCRITNAPGPAGRAVNGWARLWCALMGLRTWELTGAGTASRG